MAMLVANAGPGSKDYMERAYSTTLGLDWHSARHGRGHGDDGDRHGAEQQADFSS
jgi:hypothetical protein